MKIQHKRSKNVKCLIRFPGFDKFDKDTENVKLEQKYEILMPKEATYTIYS